MSRRKRCLELTEPQRLTLEQARDRHPKAYVRERAAALLAIAAGQSAHGLALQGLLKPRDPDTIYAWLRAYEEKGLAALYQLPRKDGVFPLEQINQLREAVCQAPPVLEGAQWAPTRWSLAYLQKAISWLGDYTLPGIWHILERYDIHYRRGRHAVHSPDPDYVRKRDEVWAWVQAALKQPGQIVTLYLDELSYYRQPSLASCWWDRSFGSAQPLARLSHRSNTVGRLVGALDVASGQVHWRRASKIGVRQLAAFYRQIREAYPQAQQIYVVQDNWPVHFHPEVEAAARAAGIQMVRLPTYAPWLNPIEKFWRWLKQDVLHMHRWSDQWEALHQGVETFLRRFAEPSPDLLRYVGLGPERITELKI